MNIRKTVLVAAVLTGLYLTVNAESRECTGTPFERIQRIFFAWSATTQETQIELNNCDAEAIRLSPDEARLLVTKIAASLGWKSIKQPTLIHLSDSKKTTGYTFSLLNEDGTIFGRTTNSSQSALFTISSTQPFDAQTTANLFTKTLGGTATIHSYLRK